MSRSPRHRWWLAHHPISACDDKCVVLAGEYVCSRCLGLYPGMAVGLAVGLVEQVSGPLVLTLYAIAVTPGWLQWALEEMGLYPRMRRTKAVRIVTGAVAGWGAGLLIASHIRSPWNEFFVEGAAITVALSITVLMVAWALRWLSE